MNTNFKRHEKNSKDIDTINVLIQKKYEKRKLEIKYNVCVKRD